MTSRATTDCGAAPLERERSSPTTESATRSSETETPAPIDSNLRSSADEPAAIAKTAPERSIRAMLDSSTAEAARATVGSPDPASIASTSA